MTGEILNNTYSTKQSTNQDAVPAMQVLFSPQNDPMHIISGSITPSDQAQSGSSTNANLRTEDFDSSEGRDNGWGVPNAIAVELIRIYFDKIQPWMPIMHRPLFYDKYVRRHGQNERLVDRQSIVSDESIMIFAMFAFSARFSKAAYFDGTDPTTRGEVFAERAAVIKDPIIRTVEEPSLEFVKGCVLLSCHCLTAGQMSTGAILTSVCVRLAYNLGLNDIDGDQINEDGTVDENDLDDSEAWVCKEELRRVWWAISDLDTFVSTILCQPFGIERRNMRVLLPVSDFLWFERLPTKSSVLLLQPSQTWRSLKGSPHQSGRAWYLVSNHLSSCIADAARLPSRTSSDQIDELESALSCLKLALPANFQLQDLHIDATNFADSNWIISTLLMILACETILERLAGHEPHTSSSSSITDDPTRSEKRFQSMLLNIARVWPPEYIPLVHPIMCCAMINPRKVAPGQNDSEKIRSSDLSELLITHISRYWKLGSASLRLIAILKNEGNESTHPPTSEERLMMKHFPILDPSPLKRRILTTSTRNRQIFPSAFVDPAAHDPPTPDFIGVGSPSDFRWPQVNIWDHFQDFEVDQSQSSMMKFSSNIVPVDIPDRR